MGDRILHKGLKSKVMSAEAAAALIPNGSVVGMSGFTGAGYPKAVPIALSKRALDEKLKGKPLKLDVLTGASTGPEQDTMMSTVEASRFRFPYQGDAATREKINWSATATTARARTTSTSPSSRSPRSTRTAPASRRPPAAPTTSTSRWPTRSSSR